MPREPTFFSVELSREATRVARAVRKLALNSSSSITISYGPVATHPIGYGREASIGRSLLPRLEQCSLGQMRHVVCDLEISKAIEGAIGF